MVFSKLKIVFRKIHMFLDIRKRRRLKFHPIAVGLYGNAMEETQSLTIWLHLGRLGVDVASLDILISQLLTNQNFNTTM